MTIAEPAFSRTSEASFNEGLGPRTSAARLAREAIQVGPQKLARRLVVADQALD